MNLPDSLAAEAIRQLLLAMQALPTDATATERIKLVSEASRLLERTETKATVITRLGSHTEQGAA